MRTENLRNGWAAFDAGRHEEAAQQFDMAIRADGHDWNKGYAQKCQLLRAQYFFDRITKAQFFTNVRSVYDEWFEKNPNDVHNFFAGVATGKIRKKEDFSGTVYEFLFDIAEDDLINIFVGH